MATEAPGAGGTDDDVEVVPDTRGGNPAPRRSRWRREEELQLLTAFKEYEAKADEAQTRRTVAVDSSDGETDGGVNQVPKKTKKKRINISQAAFKRDCKRWKAIAATFVDCSVQRPFADQCKNKFYTLKRQYLAIARVKTRTGGKNY